MKGAGRFIFNLFLLAIILVIGVGLYYSKMGAVIPGQWLASKKTAGIFVTGTGEQMSAPDVAKISLGVSEMDTAVADSFKNANRIIDKVKAALTNLSIDDKDIQTSRYSIYPEYTYTDNDQNLKGYRTEEILTITVRDTAKINDVVSDSVDAGANRIEDISFTVEDPSRVAAQARDKALIDAKNKAEQIAKSFGASVGQVISVEESLSNNQPGPLYTKMESGMGAGGSTTPSASVSPGQLAVDVNVTVNYALKY